MHGFGTSAVADLRPKHPLPHRLPTELLWAEPVALPSMGLLVRVLLALHRHTVDSENTVKPGTGRRQQLILRLLADGAPRTCECIASEIAASAPAVHETIAIMLTRHWVQEVGRNSHYPAQVWRITDDGRRIIPPQYSRPATDAGRVPR
ncbi:hypothetical protein [Nocardia sp. BMG51109]|uniref:hypothetical protein n=1 Tax=Nocardia sp. BMG51109 TaxID=1056816 RepID=UPI000466B482|nr:hypothetical protein [Nocardia sp. BMG51109]